jgi:L-malate glycosyltransferase
VRLTVVTAWYPSHADPVEGVFVARHVEALRLRHTVDVVHLAPRPGVPLDPTVERVVVDRRNPVSVLAAQRVVRARTRSADVLHTHVFSTLLLLAGLRGPLRPRVPWVHSEHWSGVSDPESGGALWDRVSRSPLDVRRLLAGPDVVAAVSSYLARAVTPFRRGRPVVVVPNVVPVPARTTAAAPGLRLLSVGNLRPVKDPLLAVAVLADLVARGHDARLRWVGDGPLRADLERRAWQLGVDDRLRVLGRLAPPDFADEWSACRVFLLPSHYETFCVAGAEALGHGRPAVLGARGGARDFDGPGARLVADRDVASWSAAVLETATRSWDPEAVAAPIRARYSPAAVAASFDEAFTAALAVRPGMITERGTS